MSTSIVPKIIPVNKYDMWAFQRRLNYLHTFFTVVPREPRKNQVFLRFFANIFLLVCRMVTIFLLTQTARLSGPFRYLEHVRKANRKFLDAFEKSFSPKNEVL